MRALVTASARHPWLTIVVYAILTIVAAIGLTKLREEDDVFVFLPEDDPDVTFFKQVSDHFGALRVALVGARLRDGSDVFSTGAITEIRAATGAFGNVPGVNRVMSLTSVADVTTGPFGADIRPLVETVPQSEAESAELRGKVLARDQVAGNLVSRDGSAAMFVLYVAEGIGTSAIVEHVRDTAARELPGFELYYGGAPFAADAIYGEARSDLTRLAPVAGAVLVLVVLMSFRAPSAVLLTIWTVAFATLSVLGVMGFLGEKFTALTSTLPIILLATGSTYAIHVLGRFDIELSETGSVQQALARTGQILAAPVAIAAWTTSAAFLSFLIMDVRPMRVFGVGVGLGTIVCWLTAVTLVPAVLRIRPRHTPERGWMLGLGHVLSWAWERAMRHRFVILASLALLTLCAVVPLGGVRVRMEPQAFFREGSPAWQSQRFLEDTFGGARFVQVAIDGDFEEPANLQELARITDFARSIPSVTQVTSLVDPIAITSGVLGGGGRLPETRGQAAQIFLFLESEPSLRSMITSDHTSALLHLRVRGEAEPIVSTLERWLERELDGTPGPVSRNAIVERIAWIARAQGVEADENALAEVAERARLPDENDPNWLTLRSKVVREFATGEDAIGIDSSAADRIVAAASSGDQAVRKALFDAAESPDDGELAWQTLQRSLSQARFELAVENTILESAKVAGIGQWSPGALRSLRMAISLLFTTELPHAHAPLQARVTGEPVLDRAFSRSVARNQVRSMILGLVTVMFLVVLLFRSFVFAVTSVVPALVTAIVLGGLMGLLHVEIDISTAMVGAILTDSGSDFSMHYLWYLRRTSPREVTRSVGPVMLVSTTLVASGFLVFCLAESPVMRRFGALSGGTVVVSALVSVVLVPAVWNWLVERV